MQNSDASISFMELGHLIMQIVKMPTGSLYKINKNLRFSIENMFAYIKIGGGVALAKEDYTFFPRKGFAKLQNPMRCASRQTRSI